MSPRPRAFPAWLRGIASVCLLLFATSHSQAEEYDVVILNGRVVDPESNSDEVRNLGIRGNTIQAITAERLRGRTMVDASGLLVSPGFIDLSVHDLDGKPPYALRVLDGVTTALTLERGTADLDRWYAEHQGKAPINYGVSIGHVPIRKLVMRDTTPGPTPSGDAAHKAASDEELAEIKRLIEQGMRRGAVMLGLVIQWTPGASPWEIQEALRIAARFGAPSMVHIRYQGAVEPLGSVLGLEEIIGAAAVTGAPVHIIHITSMGLRATPHLLQMIHGAQSHGLDITADAYPYTGASNPIRSSMLDEGWQARLGIDYHDLQWTATGERLTAESFARYRETDGRVVLHMIPEHIVQLAVADPSIIMISDSVTGHPRSAGSFARVLGKYVREAKALSLMDALRKLTLLPAQRLERRVPMMKNKGRIRVGADADLTVFDPGRIIDKASYEAPTLPSEGIKYVLVNGVVVVRDGAPLTGIFPGRPVRAPAQ